VRAFLLAALLAFSIPGSGLAQPVDTGLACPSKETFQAWYLGPPAAELAGRLAAAQARFRERKSREVLDDVLAAWSAIA
jgi:hypothetical protein